MKVDLAPLHSLSLKKRAQRASALSLDLIGTGQALSARRLAPLEEQQDGFLTATEDSSLKFIATQEALLIGAQSQARALIVLRSLAVAERLREVCPTPIDGILHLAIQDLTLLDGVGALLITSLFEARSAFFDLLELEREQILQMPSFAGALLEASLSGEALSAQSSLPFPVYAASDWSAPLAEGYTELKGSMSCQELVEGLLDCSVIAERRVYPSSVVSAFGKSGHAECKTSFSDLEARQLGYICPVCHKKMTLSTALRAQGPGGLERGHMRPGMDQYMWPQRDNDGTLGVEIGPQEGPFPFRIVSGGADGATPQLRFFPGAGSPLWEKNLTRQTCESPAAYASEGAESLSVSELSAALLGRAPFPVLSRSSLTDFLLRYAGRAATDEQVTSLLLGDQIFSRGFQRELSALLKRAGLALPSALFQGRGDVQVKSQKVQLKRSSSQLMGSAREAAVRAQAVFSSELPEQEIQMTVSQALAALQGAAFDDGSQIVFSSISSLEAGKKILRKQGILSWDELGGAPNFFDLKALWAAFELALMPVSPFLYDRGLRLGFFHEQDRPFITALAGQRPAKIWSALGESEIFGRQVRRDQALYETVLKGLKEIGRPFLCFLLGADPAGSTLLVVKQPESSLLAPKSLILV